MGDRSEHQDERPTVVVFTGGEPPGAEAVAGLPADSLVIAADSGLDHAQAVGWPVDVVVGDLDSVGAEALALAEQQGVTVERHPIAKDQTDLGLALQRALELGAGRVVVVGGGGGRLDHLLANTLVLASSEFSGATIEARHGRARVHVVRDQLELVGRPGDLVSLLPALAPATGITTEGLLYPLVGETLLPGSTRGVSNELVDTRASVSVDGGVLLAVVPGERGTHFDRIDQEEKA
jgi:thiamine pyrophosphokinase